MIELLRNTDARRLEFRRRFERSLHYYRNENDITLRNAGESKVKPDGKDELLRHADNRVSSNYHQLLVDQEAGYLATTPPAIDVENTALNDALKNTLGDNFNLRLEQLVVDASNAGMAWLHYWIDEDQQFRYGVVPPDQVTPIYSNDLDRKLLAVRRTYQQLNPADGKSYYIHEYWTDQDVTAFKSSAHDYVDLQTIDDRFSVTDVSTGETIGTSNVYQHGFGRVPFIGFPKNKLQRPDLFKYKGLIDVYDNVFNGFVNDINDVQQVILVLTNYGGTDLDELMQTLKKDKAIKMDSIGPGDKSGVDKLTIDIPVEARDNVLQRTDSKIFVDGQGINPVDFKTIGNASGTAIRALYGHLELKASITEAYFRDALNELVRAMMNWLGVADANSRPISQMWTRTAIQNSLEQAQVVAQVAPYSSSEAIAKANPIITDWQQELVDRQADMMRVDVHEQPGENQASAGSVEQD